MCADLGNLGTRKSHYLEPRSLIRSCHKMHKILVTDNSDLEPKILSFMILDLIFGTENQILAVSIQDFLYPDDRLSFVESLFDDEK